ncbi:MAG: hypothetical protein EB060_05350 [Proteobacteria bacterium]|nr:hypothetical protein [Pseudomonadota bacterium]
MSWVGKFGKQQHSSALDAKENDIPLHDVKFLRIGSAHAVQRGGDAEVLQGLLEKFVAQVNMQFDPDPDLHRIVVKHVPKSK